MRATTASFALALALLAGSSDAGRFLGTGNLLKGAQAFKAVAGGPTLAWQTQTLGFTPSGSSQATNKGANPSPTSGQLIVLVVSMEDSNAVARNTTCPSSPTFTQVGPYYDSYNQNSVSLCYRISDGTETGAFTYTWTGTTSLFKGAWLEQVWNGVTSVDAGGTGSGGNSVFSSSVVTAPDGTRVTSGAGRALISYFDNGGDDRNLWTGLPTSGAATIYDSGCTNTSAQNKYFVQLETGLASGAVVQRTATGAASGTVGVCNAATGSGIGFSLTVAP